METIAWVLAAPFLSLALMFVCWNGVLLWDLMRTRLRVWHFGENIRTCPPPAALDPLTLQHRLWEADWLLRHSSGRGYLNTEELRRWYAELRDQLYLQQISQEAYELWDRATLGGRIDPFSAR